MDILGIILAGLLLLTTLNSTYFFLVLSKVRFLEWIVFNACAPSSIVYLIGFVVYLFTKDRTILYASVLPILFYGGIGLFQLPWRGVNLMAQIGHLIMVANILWAFYGLFASNDYQAATVGLLIGTVVFTPFIAFQHSYSTAHPEVLQKIGAVPNDPHRDISTAG